MPTATRLTRAGVLKAMRLGDDEVAKLRRVFYQAKATEYRATLNELLARYGEPRKTIRLSAEIREALDTEAERDARSVVATYNAFAKAEAARWPRMPPARLAAHLADYLRERGRNRADFIARAETATPRLDAQISFYRENGVDPTFDFTGPAAKCPICKALKGGGPWPIETVLAVGQIHIGCTHSWKARLYSAAKLRRGGARPGRISAGRGGVAGIVNGPLHGGYPTPDAAAAAIESGRLGELVKRFDPDQPRDPGGEGGGRWIKVLAALTAELDLSIPPGEAIKDGRTNRYVSYAVKDVNEAIDKVHSFPADAPPIDVRKDDGTLARLGAGGGIVRSRSAGLDKPQHILIDHEDVHAGIYSHWFSLAHEIGHYLDLVAFGSEFTPENHAGGTEPMPADYYASNSGDVFADVLRAAEDTAAVKSFRQRLVHESQQGSGSGPAVQAIQYMIRPHEIVARAYAQWIAIRSGDEKLLNALRRVQEDSGDAQWSDSDFEQIGLALDTLFSERGWLK